MSTPQSAVGSQKGERAGDLARADRTVLRATPGLYRRAWRRFRHDHLAMASLTVAIVIVLFAVGAPVVSKLTGFTYNENHLSEKLSKPGENGYILGSDRNGRDILTRLAYGGRVSLRVAIFATMFELAFGLGLGMIAGYYGRWVDSAIMRGVDVLLSVPTLPLLILISTLYAPGVWMLSLIIGAIYWGGDARLIRGEVLSLRGREYIDAAKVTGVPSRLILLRHVLPNVTPILLIQASLTIPGVIILESIISFIGLGVQVPTPSWGNMLNEAQSVYRTNWQNVFIPGLMIYITSLSLYLVGIGLRDALDPRLSD